MKYDMNSSEMTLYPTGHIDSSNAPAIEKDIMEIVDGQNPSSLILDMENLEYISSAGLRIILKLTRKYGENLKLINVAHDVYEVFEMTGFTEMVTVEKAFRVFDVTGCEIIGAGANGTVYRIDRDTIVKVYKDATSLDSVKRERELSRTAFVLGIPTAIPYDVVKVGETYGSVFELLNAKSFDELMIEDANNLEFVAEKSMEIAKIIHSTPAPANLPSQQEIAFGWAEMVRPYFDEQSFSKLRMLIEKIPDDGMMIHGDLHIKNIMLQNDETLLIDMDTLCEGHPIYELAFMFNAYKGFGVSDPGEVERFLGISADTAYRLWRRSLEIYLETNDKARLDEVEEKASFIGYLRVMRRAIRIGLDKTEDGRKLIAACKEKLDGLLTRVDTLDF